MITLDCQIVQKYKHGKLSMQLKVVLIGAEIKMLPLSIQIRKRNLEIERLYNPGAHVNLYSQDFGLTPNPWYFGIKQPVEQPDYHESWNSLADFFHKA